MTSVGNDSFDAVLFSCLKFILSFGDRFLENVLKFDQELLRLLTPSLNCSQ